MRYALLVLIVLLSFAPDLRARGISDTSASPYADIPDMDTNARINLSPNFAGKSLMTPAGWSANGTFIFLGLGGVYPQAYTESPDLVAVAGFGVGNSYKIVSVAAAVNVNDVSGFNNYSLTLLATHTFKRGSTIGAGAMHLFADKNKTDAPASMYIRFSHAVQSIRSKTPGYARLNYTIGIGTGRFLKNTELDIIAGKKEYGTAVFANVSFEVFKNVNLNVEWTGVNLCTTIGIRPWAKLPGISLGVADLTKYSGDGPHFIGSISYAFYVSKKK